MSVSETVAWTLTAIACATAVCWMGAFAFVLFRGEAAQS